MVAIISGKTVVLGVCGGIAAYKAAELASWLVREGAHTYTVMTEAATNFITPLTFQALTGNPVYTSLFPPPGGLRMPHIELARSADLLVIVPATANIIAKMAVGLADDLLSTLVLAASCPVLVCPAMNPQMFAHAAVQRNLQEITRLGYHVIGPASGRVACGESGPGRLADLSLIQEKITYLLHKEKDMLNLKILITAGGTREAIDPVRFISNRSSGKMGYALARAAARRGAEVILVTAPTSLAPPPEVRVIAVESALEMYEAVLREFPKMDVVIKAAAVADYRPLTAAGEKIKKAGGELTITLVENPDILAELGRRRRPEQILVGFAAETTDLEANAKEKLKRKNVDLIVANDVTIPGAGFGSDTNKVKIFMADGQVEELPMMSKDALADYILDLVLRLRVD